MRPRVTPRALSLLALFAAAACGSGRLVPVDTAQPSGAGAPSETFSVAGKNVWYCEPTCSVIAVVVVTPLPETRMGTE